MTVDQAREMLAPLGQEHVLRFWDRLDAPRREALLAQISALDPDALRRMAALRHAPATATPAAAAPLEPAPVACLEGPAREAARAVGEAALRAGQVGVILVAGGQGSRLGFEGPKGSFPIGPISGAPLFQFHARKILALEQAYGTQIPFYIMTSDSNDAETQAFFRHHDFFGLDSSRVFFFVQGMWPALDADGRIILDRPDHLFMSPDGHGGTLSALRAAGLLDDMQRRGLRMLFYFQVDNPLVDVADPVFLGFHALQRADISIKVCAKRDPGEKLGVVVARDGRCAMVEYTELTPEQQQARLPDGTLKFRYGSVAIHVFDATFLRQQADAELPLHLAHKKVPSCGPDGALVTPAQPNAYKFEKFIFDVIPNAARTGILEFAREDEFSPVKNKEGEDSPEQVRRDLIAKAARWLELAGATVPRDAAGAPRHRIEIDPVYAHDPRRLAERITPGLVVDRDLLLGEKERFA